jgi:hypothetical protein
MDEMILDFIKVREKRVEGPRRYSMSLQKLSFKCLYYFSRNTEQTSFIMIYHVVL